MSTELHVTRMAITPVSLIRFGGHFPKGGYDVQNGIKQDGQTCTATVH
jgi:hypothetical protein